MAEDINIKFHEGMSFYIGENSMGLPFPIFYDPHFAIAINRPPVTQITGSPGSGKTFTGLLFAAHSSLSGKLTFVIDPKGDFAALSKLYRLKEINPTAIWTVFDQSGEVRKENQGMLDPTLLGTTLDDRVALTADIVADLIGEITPKQRNTLIPIIRDVVKDPRSSSFIRVVQKVQSERDDEIRSLGYALDVILSVDIAKLLVRNKRIERQEFSFSEGTIVASLLGLELPPETKPRNSYNTKEKVSVAIMGLLTSLVLNTVKRTPKNIQKTVIIDEAWSIMGNETGAQMVESMALLVRSMNCAFILLSQSPLHFEGGEGKGNLDTAISSRFAFRNNDARSNYMTCEAMDLPENEGWEDLIPTLNTGECIYQDCHGQKGIVQIVAPEEWLPIFNTNPQTLRQEEKKLHA